MSISRHHLTRAVITLPYQPSPILSLSLFLTVSIYQLKLSNEICLVAALLYWKENKDFSYYSFISSVCVLEERDASRGFPTRSARLDLFHLLILFARERGQSSHQWPRDKKKSPNLFPFIIFFVLFAHERWSSVYALEGRIDAVKKKNKILNPIGIAPIELRILNCFNQWRKWCWAPELRESAEACRVLFNRRDLFYLLYIFKEEARLPPLLLLLLI